MSTIIALVSIYYSRFDDTPAPAGSSNKTIRSAILRSSVIFWDAVIWFALLASIAGMFYLQRAQSVYEYTLCVHVVYLMTNALGAMIFMYLREDVRHLDGRHLRIFGQFAVYFVTQCVWGYSLPQINNIFVSGVNYVDLPCYAAELWPIKLLTIVTWLQEAIHILLVLVNFIPVWRYFFPEFFKRIEGGTPPKLKGKRAVLIKNIRRRGMFDQRVWGLQRQLLFVVGCLTIVVLWVDFVFIVWIRNRAQAAFGPSYEDNAIGYGQVIASGFAAQAIITFTASCICKYRSFSKPIGCPADSACSCLRI